MMLNEDNSVQPWHELARDATAVKLAVDPAQGLPAGEAELRLARHGPNALPAWKGACAWTV